MTKKNESNIAVQEAPLPAETQREGRGFEDGIDNEDLIIPRAKLLQAMSPEMSEGFGFKVGDIINSLTKEVLSETFTPIFMTKSYIRFNPRKKDDPAFDEEFAPGEIIWRTNDSKDQRVKDQCYFGPHGEKPLATTFLNFFCKFDNQQMPIILSFSKTSYKAGKQLLSLCRFNGGDMFGHKYKLASAMETKDLDTFAVLKISAAGKATAEEHENCSVLWETYSPQKDNIVTDHSGEEERPY